MRTADDLEGDRDSMARDSQTDIKGRTMTVGQGAKALSPLQMGKIKDVRDN